MFYCEKCRQKRNWPRSIAQSLGSCEICKETATCNDIPSSKLPPAPIRTPAVKSAESSKVIPETVYISTFVICACDEKHHVVFSVKRNKHPEGCPVPLEENIPAIGSQVRFECPNRYNSWTYKEEVIAAIGPMMIEKGQARPKGCIPGALV